MRRRSSLFLLLIATAALGLAACGGGSDGDGGDGDPRQAARNGLGVPGLTVFTLGGDILVQEGDQIRALLVAEGTVSYLSPVVSPDRSEVAYVLFDQKVGLDADISSDLHIIDLDGDDRAVVIHEQRAEFFWTPRWSPDGGSLIYARQTQTDDALGVVFTIEVLDLASGERRELRSQAREPDFSPRDDLITFVDSPQIDSRLAVLNPTSGEMRPLLSGDDGLTSFRVPQFSPDGEWIAFLASGDGPSVAAGPVASLSSALNGVQDVWMIRPDGSGLRRLTTVLEDQPDIAWSSDGRHILLRGAFGVYTVEVEARLTVTLGPGEFHGWHDWQGLIADDEEPEA